MAERQAPRRKITFSPEATVRELADELHALDAQGLGSAKVRATCTLAFDGDGGYITSITAEGEPIKHVPSERIEP